MLQLCRLQTPSNGGAWKCLSETQKSRSVSCPKSYDKADIPAQPSFILFLRYLENKYYLENNVCSSGNILKLVMYGFDKPKPAWDIGWHHGHPCNFMHHTRSSPPLLVKVLRNEIKEYHRFLYSSLCYSQYLREQELCSPLMCCSTRTLDITHHIKQDDLSVPRMVVSREGKKKHHTAADRRLSILDHFNVLLSVHI